MATYQGKIRETCEIRKARLTNDKNLSLIHISTKEANGIKLTQMALNNEIGNIGTIYVAVAILLSLIHILKHWKADSSSLPSFYPHQTTYSTKELLNEKLSLIHT